MEEKYAGKTIVIEAHSVPQLVIEVITKNITWEVALKKDWRKNKSWQPGWEYVMEDK